MKTLMFQTQWNRVTNNKCYETPKMPSRTVPDMTLSIQEILKRYASGAPMGHLEKVGMYESEEEAPEDDDILTDGIDPRTLDIHERHEMYQESKRLVKEYREQMKDLEQKRKKHKERTEIIQEYENQQRAKAATSKQNDAGSGLPEQPSEKPE